MCHIYAHADPILYETRSRSVRISKMVTSIRLENLFWDTLSQIASDDGVTTNQLLATLYEEVYASRGESFNFASFLRVTCMRYLEMRAASAQDAKHVLKGAYQRVESAQLPMGGAVPVEAQARG